MKCCRTPWDTAACWINAIAALNIGLCALGIFDMWKLSPMYTMGLGYPLMLLVGLSGAWMIGHAVYHMIK
ncbi:hypothetical protein JW872_02505 [Candidatus Babeliales bacterium]|nr:hypothetical protein [Candidatus Babeliales bacterium]